MASLDKLLDLPHGLLLHERADLGARLGAVADQQRTQPCRETASELLGNGPLDEEPGAGVHAITPGTGWMCRPTPLAGGWPVRPVMQQRRNANAVPGPATA